MGLFNNFPYTNLENINLDYTLRKLDELYTRGENLYTELSEWKDGVDADLAQWKNDVEADLNQWKEETEAAIDADLGEYKDEVTAAFADLTDALETHLAEIETTAVAARDAAAASALAASGSATAAANSATAAAASAASITAETAQIAANTTGITDLKTTLTDTNGITLISNEWSEAPFYIKLDGESVTIIDGVIQTIRGTAGAPTRCFQTSASAGDVFTIFTRGGAAGRAWGFVAADGTILETARASETDNDFVIKAPSNTAFFAVNDFDGNGRVYSGSSVSSILNTDSANIDLLEKQITAVTFNDQYIYKLEWERGTINSDGSLANSGYRMRSTGFINFNGVDTVKVTVPNAKEIRWYRYADADLSSYETNSGSFTTSDFELPVQGYYKFLIELTGVTTQYVTPDGFEFTADILKHQYINMPKGSYTGNIARTILRGDQGYKNNVFECRTYYTGTNAPTVTFTYKNSANTELYKSIKYVLGKKNYYITQQFRMPPFPENADKCVVDITIPNGHLYIDYFSNEYSNDKGIETPYRLNAHLGIVYPSNTYEAFITAAKTGYRCCIANARITSDGVLVCIHDAALYKDFENTDGTAISDQTLTVENSTYAELLSYNRKSTNYDFMSLKVCTIEEFFDICMKTGMHPMFSIGSNEVKPYYSDIKNLAIKYHLLDRLNMKGGGVSFLISATQPRAYDTFGDEIESYTIDISAADSDITSNTDFMDYINDPDRFNHSRIGVEYSDDVITQEKVTNALNAGLFVADFFNVSNITTDRYKELLSWGVTEFTDDYNQSNGLVW